MEYVKKNETTEYRELFKQAFFEVANAVSDLKYYFRLIGGAKRNLVLDKPNKGFDFDYQIIFYKSLLGEKSSSQLIAMKTDFRLAFDRFFLPRGYQHGEDSRSAITIKRLNQDGSIHHSFDITLLSPSKNAEDKHLHILRYEDDKKTKLTWNQMGKSIIFNEKYKKIKGIGKWNELRDRYKEKQEIWNGEKKSFSLLMEVVNEIQLDQ
jgi:hypothetical protein